MNRPVLRRSKRLANHRTPNRNKNSRVPNRMHRRRAMNTVLVSQVQPNENTAGDRQQSRRGLGGQELRDGTVRVRELQGRIAEQEQRDEVITTQHIASTAEHQAEWIAEQEQRDEVIITQHSASTAEQEVRNTDGQQQRDEQRNEVMFIGQHDVDDSDVIYMYTVDHRNGRMVELVDLTEENQQNTAGITGQATVTSNVQGPGQPVVVIGETLKKSGVHRPESSLKTKPQKKRQRCSTDIRCPACRRSYDAIQKKGKGFYSARCGHLLCFSCFTKLPPPRLCVVCNVKIMDFCRIFL